MRMVANMILVLAVAVVANTGLAQLPGVGQVKRAAVPLGAPGYVPTVEKPTGWRGDWTGIYPGATPPTDWKIEKDGKGKKVLWHTQLPMYCGGSGASQPIVIGEKIYFCAAAKDATKGPCDLYCLNLSDGRILWIKPLTAYDTASEADKKQVKTTVDSLVKDLQTETLKLAEELNAGKINQDNWRGDIRAKRQEIGSRITAALEGVDKEKYKMGERHDWGYASATPCSDGQFIYVWYANRIGGCFDLNGKLIWATMEPKTMRPTGEHGSHCSPLPLPDRIVVVYGNLIQAFDKKNGRQLWQKDIDYAWGISSSSVVARKVKDGVKDGYLIFMATTQAFRWDTGESLWGRFEGYQGENTTPVIGGDFLYTYERSGIRSFRLPTSINVSKLEAEAATKEAGGYQVASPVFFDGLVYCVNEMGLLLVFDPKGKGEIVYQQKLELKGEHGWVGAPGLSPSPCIAGKTLYVMDNQGTMVAIQPGKSYKQLARFENASGDVFVASPVFSGRKIILRGQASIYCVGEK